METEAKVETRGRPAHVPSDDSRKMVRVLSGIGLTQEQICSKMGISSPTLKLYYSEELELGKAEAVASIANTLFNMAKGGDKACMFFYLKTQARWKENHDGEGSNGEKIIRLRGGFEE